MIPLRDRNPTYHRAVITFLLIVVNVVVFFIIQPRSGTDSVVFPDGVERGIASDVRFTFEHAAIPCEISQQRPLGVAEIAASVSRGIETCSDNPDSPLFPDKHVWLAGIVSLFLHADIIHLGSNMLFLWVFGNNIEDRVGPVRYLAFYLLAGSASLAAHIAVLPDSAVPVIGASGAIAGVMGAYLAWFPRAPVTTLVFVLLREVPAGIVLALWFLSQFFVGADSQIAWAAHVGGFAFGLVVGGVIRAIPALRRVLWREPWRTQAAQPWDATGGIGSSRY